MAQANLDKVKATVTESTNERDVDNSVTVGEKRLKVVVFRRAMNGMKST